MQPFHRGIENLSLALHPPPCLTGRGEKLRRRRALTGIFADEPRQIFILIVRLYSGEKLGFWSHDTCVHEEGTSATDHFIGCPGWLS
jgi:hypothetical protein